jgi:RNA polymerase sigma-70 factor (ECF subfamily)
VDRRRAVVEAFLAASREGDFDALVALLHPDVVVEADLGRGRRTARGARSVAEQALLFTARSRFARPALVDGAVGIVVAPRGRLAVAMTFTVTDGRITRIHILGDPAHLAALSITVPG